MDITQPLADIPQFEYYREFDNTTAEFDLNNNRPKHFWYRVSPQFIKKMEKSATDTLDLFPREPDINTYTKATSFGYQVPDIFKYPWEFTKDLNNERQNEVKDNWFIRFILLPLLLPAQ